MWLLEMAVDLVKCKEMRDGSPPYIQTANGTENFEFGFITTRYSVFSVHFLVFGIRLTFSNHFPSLKTDS